GRRASARPQSIFSHSVMDKKNMTIGAVLLAGAILVAIFAPRSAPPTKPANAQPATLPGATPATTAPAPGAAPASTAAAESTTAAGSTLAAVTHENAAATITTLANDTIEVRLTDFGGAVQEVAFKKYPAIQGETQPYVFNHFHENPILALVDYPGLGLTTRYERVSASPTEVVYRTVLEGKVEVTRRYRLTKEGEPGADPYRIRHETTFRNLTKAGVALPRPALS